MDQIDNVDSQNAGTSQDEAVDGYSDNLTDQDAEHLPDPADPGAEGHMKPMSAEERAKAEAEIRKDERENAPGDLGH